STAFKGRTKNPYGKFRPEKKERQDDSHDHQDPSAGTLGSAKYKINGKTRKCQQAAGHQEIRRAPSHFLGKLHKQKGYGQNKSHQAKNNWNSLWYSHIVNYPPTAEPMGWASGVADSPNGNASSRFCLESDCIPQPDNLFIPCFNIFFAAFTSLSCTTPQGSQVHSLMESVRSRFIHPQLEHVLLLGKNLSILTNCLSFHLALYSSMV